MFRYFATAILTLTLVSPVALADTPNPTTNGTSNTVTVEGTNTGNTNAATTDATNTTGTTNAVNTTGTTTPGTTTTVPNEGGTTPTTVETSSPEEIADVILGSKDEGEIFESILKVWSQENSSNKWVMFVFLCLFLVLKVVFRFLPLGAIDKKLGTSKWKAPAMVAIVTAMSVIVSLATSGASWDVAMNAAVVGMGAIGMNESWKGFYQVVTKKDYTEDSPASKAAEAA